MLTLLGFILPFALAFIAIPLESVIHSGRAVGGVFVMAGGAMVPGIVLIILSIMFLIVISLISSTLTGVYQTALYIYARTGQVPAQYDPSIVQYAFKQKGQRDY